MPRARISEIRALLCDPRALVERLGLREGAKFYGRNAAIRCPAHDDTDPSCSVYVARDQTIAVKCHACGFSGDALHLVAAARALHIRRDFDSGAFGSRVHRRDRD